MPIMASKDNMYTYTHIKRHCTQEQKHACSNQDSILEPSVFDGKKRKHVHNTANHSLNHPELKTENYLSVRQKGHQCLERENLSLLQNRVFYLKNTHYRQCPTLTLMA